MGARGPLLRRALPGLLLWGIAGCQLLVDGELSSVHCTEEGAIGPGACPAHHVCKGSVCVDISELTHTLGDACESDADCQEGDFCLDPVKFDGTGERRCSRPCCSSFSCGDPDRGSVCWTPPAGGVSFCVDARSLQRAEPGTAASGEFCQDGSDCRSGRCAKSTCVDPCCSNRSCVSTRGTCRFGHEGADRGFFCGPTPTGNVGFAAPCSRDDDCLSGVCLDFGDNVQRCSSPCCHSGDCGTYAPSDVPILTACKNVLHQKVWIRACALPVVSMQPNDVGQPCRMDTDCRGGLCVRPSDAGGDGFCSDACCSDALCGETGGFQCRPYPLTGGFALRCEHK
jgi:hypothetical protein